MKIIKTGLIIFFLFVMQSFVCAQELTTNITPLQSPKITPLQLSIWNPVQLAPEYWDVWGLRLNLPYGKNNRVYGIDAGFVNQSTYGGAAIQAGVLANLCDKDTMIGVQVSPITNYSYNFAGVQAGGLFNFIGNGNAIQVGFVNAIGSGVAVQIGIMNMNVLALKEMGNEINIKGAQIGGMCNAVYGTMTGLQFSGALVGGNGARTMNGVQIGLAIIPASAAGDEKYFNFNNSANELYGVQIGLWGNWAKTANGLQIGLVNIAEKMTGVQIGLVNIIKSSPVPFFPVINVHF